MSRVADELAIRALVARYIDAVNRRDEAAWSATWAARGAWEIMGHRVEGRAEVTAFWRAAMAGFPFAFMQLGSGTLEFTGEDTASGRWYLSEHLEQPDGGRVQVLGCYEDRYTREDGAWCFAERRYAILRQAPGA
jgi:hypothetical protein